MAMKVNYQLTLHKSNKISLSNFNLFLNYINTIGYTVFVFWHIISEQTSWDKVQGFWLNLVWICDSLELRT